MSENSPSVNNKDKVYDETSDEDSVSLDSNDYDLSDSGFQSMLG